MRLSDETMMERLLLRALRVELAGDRFALFDAERERLSRMIRYNSRMLRQGPEEQE